MGRQAQADCEFAGQSGQASIWLEATDLILRGELRVRIPRGAISSFVGIGETLHLTTDLGPLRAHLGQKTAQAWAVALAKPLPGLAAKLGISPKTPAIVVGAVHDGDLQTALAGNTADTARIIIAEIRTADDLVHALNAARANPLAQIWGVTVKGKSAITDQMLRVAMRNAGYIDSKSCAVSVTMTATRYALRRI